MDIAPELLLSSFCYPWRLNLKNYKETKIGFDFHYEHTFVYLFQSLYFFYIQFVASNVTAYTLKVTHFIYKQQVMMAIQ